MTLGEWLETAKISKSDLKEVLNNRHLSSADSTLLYDHDTTIIDDICHLIEFKLYELNGVDSPYIQGDVHAAAKLYLEDTYAK